MPHFFTASCTDQYLALTLIFKCMTKRSFEKGLFTLSRLRNLANAKTSGKP